jgi:hypothetical protein
MFGFGREHALDFPENQSVGAARLDDICAPFGLGTAQGGFEYLPDSPEVVRADRCE